MFQGICPLITAIISFITKAQKSFAVYSNAWPVNGCEIMALSFYTAEQDSNLWPFFFLFSVNLKLKWAIENHFKLVCLLALPGLVVRADHLLRNVVGSNLIDVRFNTHVHLLKGLLERQMVGRKKGCKAFSQNITTRKLNMYMFALSRL